MILINCFQLPKKYGFPANFSYFFSPEPTLSMLFWLLPGQPGKLQASQLFFKFFLYPFSIS